MIDHKEYHERMDAAMENLVTIIVQKGLMTDEHGHIQRDDQYIDFVAEYIRNL